MTDSFVTQCPHCQTHFRVNYQQLSAARGVVRCGACLQVFNAARQLLEQNAADKGTSSTPELPVPSTASAEKSWTAPEVDLDQLNFAPPPRDDTLSARRDEHDEFNAQTQLPVIEREPPLSREVAGPDTPDAAQERLSAVDDSEDEPPPQPAPKKRKPARSEPALRDDVPLLDLADDPLQLDWQARKTPWGKRLLWLGLTLLAALTLAGQYVAYQFDELARQDQYRPWFQQVCPRIGCSVPSKVDIALIRSSNLVVRSHPEFSGALVVDAIIYNRAPFSQPFPLLELRFADLNGGLIASRRFKPGEYLSGDLAGQAEMPPQTPIHIALDILDPGPKAVNYSLSFRSPE